MGGAVLLPTRGYLKNVSEPQSRLERGGKRKGRSDEQLPHRSRSDEVEAGRCVIRICLFDGEIPRAHRLT